MAAVCPQCSEPIADDRGLAWCPHCGASATSGVVVAESVPRPPGLELKPGAAADGSLQELIRSKRTRWEEDRQEQRRGRIEGIGMVLFGLSIVGLALVLFGDDVSATRISLILTGFAVTVIGTYATITGRRFADRKPQS